MLIREAYEIKKQIIKELEEKKTIENLTPIGLGKFLYETELGKAVVEILFPTNYDNWIVGHNEEIEYRKHFQEVKEERRQELLKRKLNRN